MINFSSVPVFCPFLCLTFFTNIFSISHLSCNESFRWLVLLIDFRLNPLFSGKWIYENPLLITWQSIPHNPKLSSLAIVPSNSTIQKITNHNFSYISHRAFFRPIMWYFLSIALRSEISIILTSLISFTFPPLFCIIFINAPPPATSPQKQLTKQHPGKQKDIVLHNIHFLWC